MTPDQRRPARVCAPKQPVNEVFASLASPDWKLNFDVLEFDLDQMALLDYTGLWDDVNERCGTHIDLYEEAKIAPAGLGGLIECLERARAGAADLEYVTAQLDRLRALAETARALGVPVVFLF
jgi:hypothetical protein